MHGHRTIMDGEDRPAGEDETKLDRAYNDLYGIRVKARIKSGGLGCLDRVRENNNRVRDALVEKNYFNSNTIIRNSIDELPNI